MLLQSTRFALKTWFYSLIIGTVFLAITLLGNLSSALFAVLLIVPAMLLSSPLILVFKWLARVVLKKANTPLHFHGLFLVACFPMWVILIMFTQNMWLVGAYIVATICLQVYRVIQSIRNERVKALW